MLVLIVCIGTCGVPCSGKMPNKAAQTKHSRKNGLNLIGIESNFCITDARPHSLLGTVAAILALLTENAKQGEHKQKHEIAQGNKIVHAWLICYVDYTFSHS